MYINDLFDLCKDKVVWIQTHNFPDPDAIASAFGMQKLLEEKGISSKLCYEGVIDKLSSTKMLELLDEPMSAHDEIENEMTEEDMIILVDCQKNNGNTTDLIGAELAVVDHHPTFVQVEYEYSDIRITGACASIVAGYYKMLGITPNKKVATALLYGIKMDTLQFSRGVTAFDIEMYGYLFEFIDHELLRKLESNNMELNDLQAYGTAINNIKIYGTVGFSYLDYECPDALVAILSDFILALQEVDVVVLYARRRGGYKFSFRSERDDVNAGILANEGLKEWGNGGGHATMAGGFAADEKLNTREEMVYHVVCSHFTNLIQEKWPQIL